jgi:hypothetical protein
VSRAARISRARIIAQLKLAARKGDRAALALATDAMRTWAYSPRHWEQYLQLLTHPLARLVDLTVIKQGDKIARQKGWVRPRRESRKPGAAPARKPARPGRARASRPAGMPAQPSLFPDLTT